MIPTKPIPTLRTERLILRPFAITDAKRVQELAGAREVASTTLNIPHPYEEGMAETWISVHASDWEARKSLTVAMTTEADGIVGAMGLRFTLEHQRAELGYWVGVPFWGRGYATEAAAALVDFGFSELALHRINAHHVTRNPGSGRVMQKIGMKHEGTARQHILKWEQFEDIEIYGILASEWKQRPRERQK